MAVAGVASVIAAAVICLIATLGIPVVCWSFIIGGLVGMLGASNYQALWITMLVALAVFILFGALAYRSDNRQTLRRWHRDCEHRRTWRLLSEFETHGNGWFWETDRAGKITYLSEKLAMVIDRSPQQLIGSPMVALIDFDGGERHDDRSLGFHFSTRSAFRDIPVRAAAEGEERWVSISGRPILDEIGQFRGYTGSGSDLTEKRRVEIEANRLARFDSLTGLANRQEMRQALKEALGGDDEKQLKTVPTGLFLLDLDRFKAVNDTMGHPVGDKLLKQVAERLSKTVGDAGKVGRLGGDEFEVVLPGLINHKELAKIAKSIIADLSQPYLIDSVSLTIGCSVGIAIGPDDGETPDELTRNADLALYAAKADGRGVHRFYETDMHAGAKARKRIEDDLRGALGRNELHVAYQPVVSTMTGEIVSYEALVRWDHPTRGAIPPVEFIPVAEDIRLIEPIGEWVMRTACEDVARWPDHIRVAVNVSPIQFANPGLPNVVSSALANAGVLPDRLELEITESVFLNESADTHAMFATLKRVGVRLALDDFGTGYSALGYLKAAPFDKIKIDQSFIRGAGVAGNRNAAIIKSIVTLAETLNMETTAEGVELEEQVKLVRDLGCSHIQGYFFGRPMRFEDAEKHRTSGAAKTDALSYRVKRDPRQKILRRSRIEHDGKVTDVMMRDISTTGAMVEGAGPFEAGDKILVEILEDQMFSATVRWSILNRVGMEFAENFDLERINTPYSVANVPYKSEIRTGTGGG